MSTMGPRVRTDLVEVLVFRRRPQGVEFLQLRRATPPLQGSWQPVIGHVEAGETATDAAIRELREETGLDAGRALGAWALEQVHPYFLAAHDAIVLSPRFAVEADAAFEPTLNTEHTASRWVWSSEVDASFVWPGQRLACREVMHEIVREGSLSRGWLRLKIPEAAAH